MKWYCLITKEVIDDMKTTEVVEEEWGDVLRQLGDDENPIQRERVKGMEHVEMRSCLDCGCKFVVANSKWYCDDCLKNDHMGGD